MGPAFRSPWPVLMFVLASLVAVSTGGCGGGGADDANVTPVTLPTVSVPAAVQPADKVATPEAGQGRKAEATRSSEFCWGPIVEI